MNGWMFITGLFLMFLGAGTSDADLSPYSFTVGATVGVMGLLMIFFSNKEYHNPKRLRRLWKIIKKNCLDW
jgi:hypothetical protein